MYQSEGQQDQVFKLLEHLLKRPKKDFEAFCQALVETNQGHIVTNYLDSSAGKYQI